MLTVSAARHCCCIVARQREVHSRLLIQSTRNSAWYKKSPPVSQFTADLEGENYKSVLDILNMTDDGVYVNSYSTWGFRLNNNIRIMGPCAIFPRGYLQWNVRNSLDVNTDSLVLFRMLEPKLDLLVIGVGEPEQMNVVDKNLYKQMKAFNIGLEILPTHQACSTFNFLNSEKRFVAAALIPPNKMPSRFQLDTVYFDRPSLKGDYDKVKNPELYNPDTGALLVSPKDPAELNTDVDGKTKDGKLLGESKDEDLKKIKDS